MPGDSILDEIGKSAPGLSNEEAERIARYTLRNNETVTVAEFEDITGFSETFLQERDSLPSLADLRWSEDIEYNINKFYSKEDASSSLRKLHHELYPDLDRSIRANETSKKGYNVGDDFQDLLSKADIPITAENIAGVDWPKKLYGIESQIFEDMVSGKSKKLIKENYSLGKFQGNDPNEMIDWIAASYLRWMPEGDIPDEYQTEEVEQKMYELDENFQPSNDVKEIEEEIWENLTEQDKTDLPSWMKP